MNFYQILGLRATATQEDIEAAYKDAGHSSDIERQLEVNMAYAVLSNAEKRDAFDEELLRSLKRQAIETPPPPSRESFVKMADGEYIHHHNHVHTTIESADSSLLKTGLIWFIMAMATVFVFFFMAIATR